MTSERPRPSRRASPAVKQKPTYDTWEAVGASSVPDDPSRVRLYVVAFLPSGDAFDGEPITAEGLSASDFTADLRTDKGRRRLASGVVEATARLVARIGPTDG